MSMIRTHKRETPFVQLDKGFIGNEKLSLKATGLLTYFLSKPDDWHIYMNDVQNKFIDGETSIRSAMTELLTEGYVYRWRERNELGYLGSFNYEVYEQPKFNPHSREEKGDKKRGEKSKKKTPKKKKESHEKVGIERVNPKRENPVLDNPVLDNPVLDNQVLTNNKDTDIKETNIKETNNLSINEREITNLDIPIGVQKKLMINMDRLIDDNISIYSIQETFNAYSDKVNQFEFGMILDNVLQDTKEKIGNINKIMMKSINNHINGLVKNEQTEDNNTGEVIPDWFKEQKEKEKEKKNQSKYDFSKRSNPDWLEDNQEVEKSLEKLKGL